MVTNKELERGDGETHRGDGEMHRGKEKITGERERHKETHSEGQTEKGIVRREKRTVGGSENYTGDGKTQIAHIHLKSQFGKSLHKLGLKLFQAHI